MSQVKKPEGFRKRVTPDKYKAVGLARISADYGAGVIVCSCDWSATHPRAKVLDDKAQRHVDRRHNGRAIWL